jgi:uncharacterized protein YegP (UPF0339 family)|tara:strand:- start:14112 stop:14609 length:498 start_codon:yes stop_codon:yes gene_type:complete
MCWILIAIAVITLIWGVKKNSKAKRANETLDSTLSSLDGLRKENSQIKLELGAAKESVKVKDQQIYRLQKEIEACGCREEVKPLVADKEGSLEDSEAAQRTGRMPFFDVFIGKDGHYRWNFKAKNNKIVADSGEGYTTKQNVEKGLSTLIDSIKNEDYKIKFAKK